MSYYFVSGQLGLPGKIGKYDACVKHTGDSSKIVIDIDLDEEFREIEIPVVVERFDHMIQSLQAFRDKLLDRDQPVR